MSTNELIHGEFISTKKNPIYLQSIFGSMVALTPLPNDNDVHPPAIVPKNTKIIQKSTLPRITYDDVNTVEKNKLPGLTNIYIASLTVVGLFILFRFIQKHP